MQRVATRPPAGEAPQGAPVQPRAPAGRGSQLFAVGCGFVVAAAGAYGIAGWSTEPPLVPTLGSVVDDVRPEGAFASVLGGVGLMLLSGRPGVVRRWSGSVLGGLTAAIGLMGIVDQIRGAGVHLVDLRAVLNGDAADEPLMTPAGATALLLAGLALVFLDRPVPRRLPWPQAFAPAAAAIAMVSVLAHILESTHAVPGIASLTAMPGPAAAMMLLLAAGTTLARPDRGLLRPFGSAGPGGALARRLTPTLVLLPFAIVLLSTVIIRIGHGDRALAFAFSTALSIIVLVLMVGGTVRAIDGADDRQHRLMAELAAERDLTATLLQSLSEAVVVFSPDLRVVDANPRACQVLGRRREEIVGQRPPYPWQPAGDAPPSMVGDAGLGESDRQVVRPDGSRVPVLARMSPVLDEQGRPRAFVGTFVDITGLKGAEAALADRAAALERANDRLREGNRRLAEAAEFKQDLMSMMSHEVSQPLSSVASLAELLATDWADLPEDVRLELTQKIDNNTRRLTRMINDMLLLFRLDAGAVRARRESVPVIEVADSVADSAPATAQVVTSVGPDLFALVDRGHLWQVLNNLVTNAMAYGDPPIEISAERTPEAVLVSVRDYGKGIPEEDLPYLFDRVARRAGGRKTKGSGLGLFIVRHLVEVNGGAIWYEQAQPQGARLVIRLEAAAEAAPGAPPERRAEPEPLAEAPTPSPADHGRIAAH